MRKPSVILIFESWEKALELLLVINSTYDLIGMSSKRVSTPCTNMSVFCIYWYYWMCVFNPPNDLCMIEQQFNIRKLILHQNSWKIPFPLAMKLSICLLLLFALDNDKMEFFKCQVLWWISCIDKYFSFHQVESKLTNRKTSKIRLKWFFDKVSEKFLKFQKNNFHHQKLHSYYLLSC